MRNLCHSTVLKLEHRLSTRHEKNAAIQGDKILKSIKTHMESPQKRLAEKAKIELTGAKRKGGFKRFKETSLDIVLRKDTNGEQK